MDGLTPPRTATRRAFGAKRARRSGLLVDYVDERLTSNAAYDELRSERRSERASAASVLEDIDANAARFIHGDLDGHAFGRSDTGRDLQRDHAGCLRHLLTLGCPRA
ncbi:MAG: hypothetical protein IPJ97_04595 [Proteobacteria bacterium]|nr:hypothetical protein [Pseudomonadota bacterium]